eukprot:TRINITY_DN32272_c0_g1_i5.p1 TRINITY_DN32272_c0_g1~~TRINITY_DN32272_c0_g1_i5.p1  ORF type:complete len:867 (+),score=134.27 TRINITY_DN32272_c0_g1_i5:352-2601(+)
MFDPIVLADNVELTPDQISICRLPDCFAPAPREPVDVSDQMIGTYSWAERLRWHRHHMVKRDNGKNGDSPDGKDTFVKRPWYKPTAKQAPKCDAALEDFIEACSQQFMDPGNRRKIRDNLTEGQRKAITELRDLPMTKKAACRYGDKTGATVITQIDADDDAILRELKNGNYYDLMETDPTNDTIKKVNTWITKWKTKGALTEDMADYIKPGQQARPGHIKPLVKTHKPKPFPYRFLLSGSGTPTQPLSKFVQQMISHLTLYLPYQVIDTKEFLQKIDLINKHYSPLPPTATFAVCDVVALFPNVDNSMGIPAVQDALKEIPSQLQVPDDCVIEGLKIALNQNCSQYTDGEGNTVFAKPNHGTAMGPCHACDFVDVYMGNLDIKLTKECPVPLLSSLAEPEQRDGLMQLDWSRYRDDGITVLPNKEDIGSFSQHLQDLNPPNIKWTIKEGHQVEYLDIKLSIEDGTINTDVYSKHCHSYLPKNSCHPPSVFKGLLIGVGTRLRMLCSDDNVLENRLKEYARYFTISGWKFETALEHLSRGANRDRGDLIRQERKPKPKKLAWVSQYDPRLPSKRTLIKQNLHILYSNTKNKSIFPEDMLIGADRRRRNLGEMYKPTVPRRHPIHGPRNRPGFFLCSARRCDLCAHSSNTEGFRSPWDGRYWPIKQHLTCTDSNVIYVIRCQEHPDLWYVGSTKDLKRRWANHKSDVNKKLAQRCGVARHLSQTQHPVDKALPFITIHPISLSLSLSLSL